MVMQLCTWTHALSTVRRHPLGATVKEQVEPLTAAGSKQMGAFKFVTARDTGRRTGRVSGSLLPVCEGMGHRLTRWLGPTLCSPPPPRAAQAAASGAAPSWNTVRGHSAPQCSLSQGCALLLLHGVAHLNLSTLLRHAEAGRGCVMRAGAVRCAPGRRGRVLTCWCAARREFPDWAFTTPPSQPVALLVTPAAAAGARCYLVRAAASALC